MSNLSRLVLLFSWTLLSLYFAYANPLNEFDSDNESSTLPMDQEELAFNISARCGHDLECILGSLDEDAENEQTSPVDADNRVKRDVKKNKKQDKQMSLNKTKPSSRNCYKQVLTRCSRVYIASYMFINSKYKCKTGVNCNVNIEFMIAQCALRSSFNACPEEHVKPCYTKKRVHINTTNSKHKFIRLKQKLIKILLRSRDCISWVAELDTNSYQVEDKTSESS